MDGGYIYIGSQIIIIYYIYRVSNYYTGEQIIIIYSCPGYYVRVSALASLIVLLLFLRLNSSPSYYYYYFLRLLLLFLRLNFFKLYFLNFSIVAAV